MAVERAPRVSAEALAGTTRQRYFIAGMDCPTEEGLLRKQLQGKDGVVALEFDLINRLLDVHHRLPDDAPLRAAISAAGMSAEAVDTAAAPPAPPPAISTGLRWRMALAGVAAIAAESLAFAGFDESGPLVIALAVATMLLGGLPTLRKGWIALKSVTLNIHLLMSLAVIGAIVLGQWPEAAMVVWLFGLSEMMESLSLARARDAIRALTQLAPETAQVQGEDGRWTTVPAAQVAIGARVRVPPGERVPLDGRLLSGRSSLNEAALTGEAMPVDKAPGDTLLAGSINGDGLLEMAVTADKGQWCPGAWGCNPVDTGQGYTLVCLPAGGGGPGAPCRDNQGCASGLCVDQPGYCSRFCNDAPCPSGTAAVSPETTITSSMPTPNRLAHTCASMVRVPWPMPVAPV